MDEIKKQLKQPQIQTKNGMLDLFLGALDVNAHASFQISVIIFVCLFLNILLNYYVIN